MIKDKDEAKKQVDDNCKYLIMGIRGAESFKGAESDSMMLSIITRPNISMRNTNIAMTGIASTVIAIELTGRSKINKKSENIPFASAQD